MGVVFFPSLPFMGVMLFPSFALGNASGGGGTLLMPLSLFFILLSLPLLSSPSPSFHSLFLPFFFFFHISFSPFLFLRFFHICFSLFRTNSFHHFFLLLLFSTSFSFPLFFLKFFFFLRELLVLCASKM